MFNAHAFQTTVFLIAACGLTVSAAADEDHFDVWLQIEGNQMFTGSITEDLEPINSNWRVFGAELPGADGDEPFTADEPGFQLLDGSVDPFYNFQINITDAVTAWNGNGFDPVAETMSLEFGPQSVTSGDGFVEGFQWTADANGGFHDHFEIILNGDGGDPADGIYLLPLSIADPGGAFAATDTFWFVMNRGLSEAEHELSIEWVQQNIVPTPGAIGLLGCAALFGRRRRRTA